MFKKICLFVLALLVSGGMYTGRTIFHRYPTLDYCANFDPHRNNLARH